MDPNAHNPPIQYQGQPIMSTYEGAPILSTHQGQPTYQAEEPLLLAEQLGEADKPLLRQSIKCQIESKHEKMDFVGTLCIYEDNYHLEVADIDIEVDYRITSSLGTNGSTLMVFVDSEEKEEEEEEEMENEGGNGEEEETLGDQFVKLVKSEGKGNFLMRGSCTIILIFGSHPLMQQAYMQISQRLGGEQDYNSQHANDEEMDKMISADDIDDFGNLIADGQEGTNQEQEQEEEEEDSQMVDENQEL